MKKYELSIKDCDAALKLDEGYIKALNRRATAKEELDDLRGALLGSQQIRGLIRWRLIVHRLHCLNHLRRCVQQ